MSKPHWNFWPVAGLGLFWNLMGCLNYIAQTNAATVAAMPEAYQAVIVGRPAWATGAFAIAVFGGAVGCILLLLRRAVAVQVLIISLVGVAATMLYAVMSVGFQGRVLLGTGMSMIVALALLWTARAAAAKGWLK